MSSRESHQTARRLDELQYQKKGGGGGAETLNFLPSPEKKYIVAVYTEA